MMLSNGKVVKTMPDKKLTDNEIVKALEDWIKNYDGSYVNFKTLGYALDLINRLQAENERLRESRDRWRQIAEDFDRFSREEERMIENDKERT